MSKSRPERWCLAALALAACTGGAPATEWTPEQLDVIRSLSLSALPPPPPSSSNRVASDPRAVELGHRLFFDPSLSANGRVACASCHVPERAFTDGRPRSHGLGDTPRNAPTLIGAAYSPWFFWDGRRDSLWAQALAPLEAREEMGNDRTSVVRLVSQDPRYRDAYRDLFGEAPKPSAESASPYGDAQARAAWSRMEESERLRIDRAFANVGKTLEAYVRLLRPGPSRFDRYVGGTETLTSDEVAGLRLFIDSEKTRCLRCHNGPLFTNQAFHDVATSRLGPIPDLGRFLGVQSLLLDAFNCQGAFSDAPRGSCGELEFLQTHDLAATSGQFKTPTLREVSRTAPYFHDGSAPTLARVIEHYRHPPMDPGSELLPIEITDREAAQLAVFLGALSGKVAVSPQFLAPPTPTAPAAPRPVAGDAWGARVFVALSRFDTKTPQSSTSLLRPCHAERRGRDQGDAALRPIPPRNRRLRPAGGRGERAGAAAEPAAELPTAGRRTVGPGVPVSARPGLDRQPAGRTDPELRLE